MEGEPYIYIRNFEILHWTKMINVPLVIYKLVALLK